MFFLAFRTGSVWTNNSDFTLGYYTGNNILTVTDGGQFHVPGTFEHGKGDIPNFPPGQSCQGSRRFAAGN